MPRETDMVDEKDIEIIRIATSEDLPIVGVARKVNLAHNSLVARLKKLESKRLVRRVSLGPGKKSVIRVTEEGIYYSMLMFLISAHGIENFTLNEDNHTINLKLKKKVMLWDIIDKMNEKVFKNLNK